MKMEGYVIVPPLNPWDEKHREKIILDMAYCTFHPSSSHVWNRFMGIDALDAGERARRVQYWFDRGYRIKKATLEIIDD
jgi:hypothetical protein